MDIVMNIDPLFLTIIVGLVCFAQVLGRWMRRV